jgi:hypothetical protein
VWFEVSFVLVPLPDRFETLDGSTPEAVPLDSEAGRRLPLTAFALLKGGDVFEDLGGTAPPEGLSLAKAWVKEKVVLHAHGAEKAEEKYVRAQLARQLAGNPELTARMQAGRSFSVDLIPPGEPMSRFGYPKAVSPQTLGLFWDHPSWERGRMALRREHLHQDPTLVVHEMAHAIHYLAFTKEERDTIYRLLLPRFRTQSAVDEVFAIYSERELGGDFSEADVRAPGIYGLARKQWNENHLFTRFVRHLYFPYKPLAGPTAFGR